MHEKQQTAKFWIPDILDMDLKYISEQNQHFFQTPYWTLKSKFDETPRSFELQNHSKFRKTLLQRS